MPDPTTVIRTNLFGLVAEGHGTAMARVRRLPRRVVVGPSAIIISLCPENLEGLRALYRAGQATGVVQFTVEAIAALQRLSGRSGAQRHRTVPPSRVAITPDVVPNLRGLDCSLDPFASTADGALIPRTNAPLSEKN